MEIIRAEQGALSAGNLRAELVRNFVSYIDRPGRTEQTYLTNLKQFFCWLKYKGIARPTREDIIAFRDWLTCEHDAIAYAPESPAGWEYRADKDGEPAKVTCSASTAGQYLRSIRQFFKWTALQGVYPNIAENLHAARIAKSAHKRDALTPAEVGDIEQSIQAAVDKAQEAAENAEKPTRHHAEWQAEAGKRLRAMYLLAVTAGLRTVELSRANVGHFDRRTGCLWVWGKGHGEADTKKVLAPEVCEAVKDYLVARTTEKGPDAPLFAATGNRSRGQRIASRTIGQMLKKAMVAAGYDSERITAHSLRHTAGNSVLKLTDKNIYTTQRFMRHTDPKTTEIYLHDDEQSEEAKIAKQLYELYHSRGHSNANGQGERKRLTGVLWRLTAEQVAKLAAEAEAMAAENEARE